VSVLDGTDGACVARCTLPPGLAWHALLASDGGAHLLALGAPLSDDDGEEDDIHPPATAGALLALASAPGGHTLTLVRSCALPGALTATLSSAAQVVYVARDGALFALPDDAPAPEPAEKEGLHLPNPFRARAARSSEALPLAQAEPLALGSAFEAGADVRGACMRGARGAAWTDSELKVAPSLSARPKAGSDWAAKVFELSEDGVQSAALPLAGVHAVQWVDDDALCVSTAVPPSPAPHTPVLTRARRRAQTSTPSSPGPPWRSRTPRPRAPARAVRSSAAPPRSRAARAGH
jgi:hypothetical protein